MYFASFLYLLMTNWCVSINKLNGMVEGELMQTATSILGKCSTLEL